MSAAELQETHGAITRLAREERRPPSFREIGYELGLVDRRKIGARIDELEAAGGCTHVPNRQRTYIATPGWQAGVVVCYIGPPRAWAQGVDVEQAAAALAEHDPPLEWQE